MFTATVASVQLFCVLYVQFIVVTALVDIVQCSCVVCGFYCVYGNNSFIAMLLSCVWR